VQGSNDWRGLTKRIPSCAVGVIRFALLLVWVAYIPIQPLLSSGNSLSIFSPDAGTIPVFDFYRRQLERRRDYFQDDYRKVIQLVIVGFAFILYSVLYPRLFLVFGIPIAVCGIVFHRRRSRELPQIQREIEILDRLRGY
jgi:hypothetical protein